MSLKCLPPKIGISQKTTLKEIRIANKDIVILIYINLKRHQAKYGRNKTHYFLIAIFFFCQDQKILIMCENYLLCNFVCSM